MEAFISRAVLSEEMRASPEVRVPFLHLMTSLAVGEYGAAMVLRQFAEMTRVPKLELLTWKKLFAAVVEYCVRYSTVLAESQRYGPGGGAGGAGGGGAGALPGAIVTGGVVVAAKEERLMNQYEADIMAAFLGLFKQLVEQVGWGTGWVWGEG